MPNGLNPAVAMIELINEDSFFFQFDKLDAMIEPYKSKFMRLWVQFLREKYVNTDNLKRAWTTKDGFSILGNDESIEEGRVKFPKLKLGEFSEVGHSEIWRLKQRRLIHIMIILIRFFALFLVRIEV